LAVHLVNPVIPSKKVILSGVKVANTDCPITPLFYKTNQNFPVFRLITTICRKNKPNSNPIQTQFFGFNGDIFKISKNPGNPRIKYYLFMQNEPNFALCELIASTVMIRRYDKNSVLWTLKNEPKTNPNLCHLGNLGKFHFSTSGPVSEQPKFGTKPELVLEKRNNSVQKTIINSVYCMLYPVFFVL